MAGENDVVRDGGVVAVRPSDSFPTIGQQKEGLPPSKSRMSEFNWDMPSSKVLGRDAPKGAERETRDYAILSGLTYVPGREYWDLDGQVQEFDNHQAAMGIQQFLTDHVSILVVPSYHTVYENKSTEVSLCTESLSFAGTDRMTVGACVGVEHGLKRIVDPDHLISGTSLAPKGGVYMNVVLEDGKNGILPQDTGLFFEADTLPTPRDGVKPQYSVGLRFPL